MTDREALQVERGMLQRLAAAAPRGRPEIMARLRLVTAELLKLETTPSPLAGVPEFPTEGGEPLKWYQR